MVLFQRVGLRGRESKDASECYSTPGLGPLSVALCRWLDEEFFPPIKER